MRAKGLLFFMAFTAVRAFAQLPTSLGETMATTGAAAGMAAVAGSAVKPAINMQAAPRPAAVPPPSDPAPAPEYIYDPTGLRDPFFPEGLDKLVESPPNDKANSKDSGPSNPMINGDLPPDPNVDALVRYNLETYRPVAIVWNTSEPKAMVQATNGSIYTVRIGTKIGKLGGKVAAIREREVVVAEPVVEAGKQSFIYRKIELR